MDTISLAESRASSLSNMFLHHLEKDVSTAGAKWNMTSSALFLPLEPREAAGSSAKPHQLTSDTLPTTEGISEPVERAEEHWGPAFGHETNLKEGFRGSSAKRKIKLLIFAKP